MHGADLARLTVVNNLFLRRPPIGLLLGSFLSSMDTISRENNSMLPIGGIVLGVVGLLLGGISLVQVSGIKKDLADNVKPAVQKIDAVEATANTANSTAERARGEVAKLTQETQTVVTTLGNMISGVEGKVTKLEEQAKKPAQVAGAKSKGPVVAGPDEYIVKGGDTGMKIARANGVSLADLTSVNPGIDWTKVHPGQKVKLPAKK